MNDVDPSGLFRMPVVNLVTTLKPIPSPCPPPDACIQRCLSMLVGDTSDVTVYERSAGLAAQRGYTITLPWGIYHPRSCDDFWHADSRLILHEYYHMMNHWRRGPVSFAMAWGAGAASTWHHDKIPVEIEAETWAQIWAPVFEKCLK